MTKCLGIESTAHTFGIAIVDDNGKVLSNEKEMMKTKKGGLIPRELTEHHYKIAPELIKKALKKAKCKMADINIIAFSQGPGIGNALRVGAITARQLSSIYNIPCQGVNHCIAHLEIGREKTGAKDPIMLYASGANTQIICYENQYYRVFGETLDIGIGNLLDKYGRKIGMGFPAGPKLSEIYYKGEEYIELPYTVKGMDLAFSGLLTSAINKYNKAKSNSERNNITYSFIHNAFAMLTEVTERALAHTEKKEVVLGGGVGCSKPLQEMVGKMCKERGAKLFIPEKSLMMDNAAMIAWTGIIMHRAGVKTTKKNEIKPKQRTDDVKVTWRKD